MKLYIWSSEPASIYTPSSLPQTYRPVAIHTYIRTKSTFCHQYPYIRGWVGLPPITKSACATMNDIFLFKDEKLAYMEIMHGIVHSTYA